MVAAEASTVVAEATAAGDAGNPENLPEEKARLLRQTGLFRYAAKPAGALASRQKQPHSMLQTRIFGTRETASYQSRT
jgi:hypothetical protein